MSNQQRTPSLAHSFLQVTVNSTKLTQLLEGITKSLDCQNKKISDISKEFKDSLALLDNKMRSHQHLACQQLAQIKTYIKTTKDQTRVLLNSAERSLLEMKNQNDNKIDLLNQRIARTSQNCEEQSTNFQQKLNTQLQNQKRQIQKQNQAYNVSLSIMEEKMNRNTQDTGSQIEKMKEVFVGSISDFKTCIIPPPETQRLVVNSPQKKIIAEADIVRLAAISAKLDQLENKIRDKENVPIHKVMYAVNKSNKSVDQHKNLFSSKRSYQENGSDLSMRQMSSEDSFERLFESLTSKITGIESIIVNKMKLLGKDFEQLKHRQVVTDEKLGLIGRKFEKQVGSLQHAKDKIQILEERKIDEKLIENLKIEVQKCVKRSEDMIETKCNRDIFEKQRVKTSEKITILHQNLTEKAEKNEIKKALMFLEDKIKDIIILIADDHNNEKNGAMTRLPLKCLSCDKDVEKQAEGVPHSSRGPPTLIESTMRALSSRIRKRVKLSNVGQSNPATH